VSAQVRRAVRECAMRMCKCPYIGTHLRKSRRRRCRKRAALAAAACATLPARAVGASKNMGDFA
jgi:hypothetical protein